MFRHTHKTIVYKNSGSYSAEHWALQRPDPADETFIAIIEIRHVLMGVYLNPCDARGYWTIVRLVGADMRSTLNRAYTADEKYALSVALFLTAQAYEQAGSPIVQTQILGNNSQALDDHGRVVFGNDSEPSMLHGHVISRGAPMGTYIANVPLRSPAPGLVFNVHGHGKEAWNNVKWLWEPGEMQQVAETIAEHFQKIMLSGEYEAHLVSVRSPSSVEQKKHFSL